MRTGDEQGTVRGVVIAMWRNLPGEKVVEEPHAEKGLDDRARGLQAITSQIRGPRARHGELEPGEGTV